MCACLISRTAPGLSVAEREELQKLEEQQQEQEAANARRKQLIEKQQRANDVAERVEAEADDGDEKKKKKEKKHVIPPETASQRRARINDFTKQLGLKEPQTFATAFNLCHSDDDTNDEAADVRPGFVNTFHQILVQIVEGVFLFNRVFSYKCVSVERYLAIGGDRNVTRSTEFGNACSAKNFRETNLFTKISD